MVGYVTAILAFIHAKLDAWEASRFCDKKKNGFLRFHCILLLLDSSKHFFFFFLDVLGKEYYSYAMPNYKSF